jgi:DNA-binding response OmpR family regulator
MSCTLLICDDEDLVRELVVSALRDRYRVFEASDGREALEQARLVRPDLILLDIMMPEKSGLDVLAELRRDPELAGTPVIMLTGRTQASDRKAIGTAGADGYLPKPFSLVELESTIETLLGRDDAAG